MSDSVNQPKHYVAGGVETIDVIEAWLSKEEAVGYCLGNVIKYVSRRAKKGEELQDLRKAKWYLSRVIETLEQEFEGVKDAEWVPAVGEAVRCVDNAGAPLLEVGMPYTVARVEPGHRFTFLYVERFGQAELSKTPFKSSRFELWS